MKITRYELPQSSCCERKEKEHERQSERFICECRKEKKCNDFPCEKKREHQESSKQDFKCSCECWKKERRMSDQEPWHFESEEKNRCEPFHGDREDAREESRCGCQDGLRDSYDGESYEFSAEDFED